MKTQSNNIKKNKLLLVTLILMMTVVFGTSFKKPVDDRKNQSGYVPKSGFVPNKTTAIKIPVSDVNTGDDLRCRWSVKNKYVKKIN